MLLRKIHRDAIEYVNRVRISDGLDPISDLTMGFRFDDDRSPIARAGVSLQRMDDDIKSDEVEFFFCAVAGGCAESALAWTALFYAGFYSEYNEARLYVRLPLTRRQKLRRALRKAPGELQEKYLRTKTLVEYVRKELPMRAGS